MTGLADYHAEFISCKEECSMIDTCRTHGEDSRQNKHPNSPGRHWRSHYSLIYKTPKYLALDLSPLTKDIRKSYDG